MIREVTNWLSYVLNQELKHITTSTQFLWETPDNKMVKLLPYCYEDRDLYNWLKENPEALPVVRTYDVTEGVMPENILFYGGKKYLILTMEKLYLSDQLFLNQKIIQDSCEMFNDFVEENYQFPWNSYSIIGDLMDSILKQNEDHQNIIFDFFRKTNPELLPLVTEMGVILKRISSHDIYWFDCHVMQFMEDENHNLVAIDLDNDLGYRDNILQHKEEKKLVSC